MKKNNKVLGFVAAAIFSYGFMFLLNWLKNNMLSNSAILVIGTAILIIVLLVSFLFNKMLVRISGSPVTQIKKRLWPSLLIFSTTTLVISLVVFLSGLYIVYKIEGWNVHNIFQQEFYGSLIGPFTGILIGIAIFFYAIWRQAVSREQRLREENLKYKYINLKSQVNPHFLFNSLNTLSELVYENPKRADNYIQKLSGIYRYILDHEEADLVPLGEELGFVKRYFDLQRERTGDRVRLNIDIEDVDRYKVMPVSLQILVENALKHNSASENSPLKVNIYEENRLLVVSNNIQRKTNMDNSYGTGLANLKERVRLITGRELVVAHGNNEFIVKIPIVDN